MIAELDEVLNCELHGEYRAKVVCAGTIRVELRACTKCGQIEIEKTERIERAEAVAARLKAFESRLKHSAVPERFVGKTLDNYVVECDLQAHAVKTCRDYVTDFAKHRKNGLGLMMLGKVGNGKNHLAIAVAQELMQNGYVTMYTTLPDFISDMRAWQNDKDAASQKRVIDLMRSPDLLILDEVGVGSCTAVQQDDLFRLINARYEKNKPIIILGNVTTVELSGFVGERAYDRLKQMTLRQIAFNWSSYRGRELEAE